MNRLSLLLLLVFSPFSHVFGQNKVEWRKIEAGLEFADFQVAKVSPVGDRTLQMLRIDPNAYQFELLAADNIDKKARTADQWVSEFGLTAAVNAGMFQMNGLSNVGYMKIQAYTNNPKFNDDLTLLAFEPIEAGPPLFKIIDRECENWEKLAAQYKFVSQGIRMIDCKQNNKWSQQPKIWSMVVIGMDKMGNAVFIFSRSPYSVHDLIDILLQSDLNLFNAMYLEGGPESSMCIRTTDVNLDLFGSYETGFFESNDNNRYWPIPNVIGIRPRKLDPNCNPIY